MYGLPEGPAVFNVVFFVVLVSAVLQGWTLPFLATRLQLQAEQPPAPAVSLELMWLRDVDADIVDYVVLPKSSLVNKTVQDLRLPEGAILAMISRGNKLIAPRGSTELRPHDHLFIIAGAESRQALDRALNQVSSPAA